jgi:hypothetical protein
MLKRLLQITLTFISAAIMAILVLCVDWWLYILTGKTMCKRLIYFIDRTKLRYYIL